MLEFRPHHFLCTVGFEGKGYSARFVENYTKIAHDLRENGITGDQTPIRVTAITDSICAPCPSKQGTRCESQSKIDLLDGAHAKVLGISPGQTLTWGEAKHLIVEKFTDEAFETACAPCSWKELGICKSALHRLRAASGK